MNEPDNDRLLHDLLQDGADAAFREASLDAMLSAARRTRRRRKILGLAGCAAVLLLGAALWHRPGITPARTDTVHQSSSVDPVSARKPIRYIDDKELLSLFPNRPVALIGSAHGQQLIVLDQRK